MNKSRLGMTGGKAALSIASALFIMAFAAGPSAAEELPGGESELRCLALNVYWEARGEPFDGQIAVAHVTLNRVEHEAYPATICGVVQQGALDGSKYGCQFSWTCDGRSDEPKNERAWRKALAVAWLAILKTGGDSPTGKALHYHADYVKPDWAERMQMVTQIGRHIYYEMANLEGG